MERPGQQECSLTRLFLHLRLVYNTMFSGGVSHWIIWHSPQNHLPFCLEMIPVVLFVILISEGR